MNEPQPAFQTPVPEEKDKEATGPAVAALPPAELPETPARPESRVRSFFRQALRWTLTLLFVFVLGGLTVFFVLLRPVQQQLDQTRVNASQAEQQSQQQISDLQGQVSSLQAKVNSLSGLDTTNKDLQSQLQQSEMHVTLLGIRNDVARASLALAAKNPADAKLALSKTDQSLTTLLGYFPTDQQKVVADIQSRLKLVQNELNTNTYAAQSDLDVLAKSLSDLENQLFLQP